MHVADGGGKPLRSTAPKGASQLKELTASLKRCPDTKLMPVYDEGVREDVEPIASGWHPISCIGKQGQRLNSVLAIFCFLLALKFRSSI
jgi:hypothetical protein